MCVLVVSPGCLNGFPRAFSTSCDFGLWNQFLWKMRLHWTFNSATLPLIPYFPGDVFVHLTGQAQCGIRIAIEMALKSGGRVSDVSGVLSACCFRCHSKARLPATYRWVCH